MGNRHIYIAVGLLLLCGKAHAQQQVSTATAGIGVTISTPISVSKSVNMSFSNVTVSTSQGGSVVLDPNGKESASGGISINNAEGGVPASFTVSGQGGYAYSVNLPNTPVSMDDESANALNITNFTSSPEVSGQTQAGTQTINVGATLNLQKAEETGEYDAEIPFDIRVNYN